MKICNRCILNENYRGITFNDDGICSLCINKTHFIPKGEEELRRIFEKARKKNKKYDALVPLSGGKDSTYILHLAVNIYNLKVIAMTYDNGFMSELSLDNIKNAVAITKVDHIFYKPDRELQKKIYRIMLLRTGDICGACDIATRASILKVSLEYDVPIVLYGTSPLEDNSFVPDSIEDIGRFKYVLKRSGEVNDKEIKEFTIYPWLNDLILSFNKLVGIYPREVRPLFYIKNPSDKEMGEIISKELKWRDDGREYSRHLDCIAEPFTNYIRNRIYGYERRICQYSNMVRNDEISRAHALELYENDKIDQPPENYIEILNYLGLNKKDLDQILSYRPLMYEDYLSRMNRIYQWLAKFKRFL